MVKEINKAGNITVDLSELSIDTIIKFDIYANDTEHEPNKKWMLANVSGTAQREGYIINDIFYANASNSYYWRHFIIEFTKTTD